MFDMLISIVYTYTYTLLVRAKRGEKNVAPQRTMHRQSLYKYKPISTNPRSLCTENPNRVATIQILPIPPNAQAAGELCVDKTQSPQICNLCVEKKSPAHVAPEQIPGGRNFLFEKGSLVAVPITSYWKIDQSSFFQ